MITTKTKVFENKRFDLTPAPITVVITPIDGTLQMATTLEGTKVVARTETDSSQMTKVLKEALDRVKDGGSFFVLIPGKDHNGTTPGDVPGQKGPRGHEWLSAFSTALEHFKDLASSVH